MRWLKHMTDTTSDEKIAQLIAAHGAAAYGEYWMVVEIVAKHVDKTDRCSVTYPISVWAHKLFTRGSLVKSRLSRLAVTGVLTLVCTNSEITVTIPNLLKYRDEYSSRVGTKSRACRETRTEADTEADTDKKDVPNGTSKEAGLVDAKPTPTSTAWRAEMFEEFWGVVWAKIGRGAAAKAWAKAASTEAVAEQIVDAAKAQAEGLIRHAHSNGHSVLHPATWLNQGRWQDEPEATLLDLAPPPRNGQRLSLLDSIPD